MTHRVLPHTADTGLEATADSLSALLVELATGMFELVGTGPPEVSMWVTTDVSSAGLADLVVDLLSELLYLSEAGDVLFSQFRIVADAGAAAAHVEAGGVPFDAVEVMGPPIKAVTYHQLVVENRDGVWYARVYFDV